MTGITKSTATWKRGGGGGGQGRGLRVYRDAIKLNIQRVGERRREQSSTPMEEGAALSVLVIHAVVVSAVAALGCLVGAGGAAVILA